MITTKILFFLLALDVVMTSPIVEENYADNRIEIPDPTKKIADVTNSLQEEQGFAKGEESSNCSNSNEEDKSEEGIRTPENARSALPYFQSYHGYPNVKVPGYSIGSYRRVWYPYAHPKLLASYYPGYAVKSLPPVVSTYIHGLVPEEDMQRSRYDLDVLSSQNALSPLVRQVRMLGISEEDLLAELRHDAIMNNIVPTMPVPFARYAATAGKPITSGSASLSAAPSGMPEATISSSGFSSDALSAIFPIAGPQPVPYLFTCTPKIIRGTLRQVYPESSVQALNYPADNYKKEAEAEQTKIQLEKLNTPAKVDPVGKSAEIGKN